MNPATAVARAALRQTDEVLAAHCNRVRTANGKLQLEHLPTSIVITVDIGPGEAKARMRALLQLRNQCYDLVRNRGGRPPKR